MATNLDQSALKVKLDAAIEQYNTVETNIRQVTENLDNLKNAREQLRGRVAALDDLIKDSEPEVVNAEVVDEPNDD